MYSLRRWARNGTTRQIGVTEESHGRTHHCPPFFYGVLVDDWPKFIDAFRHHSDERILNQMFNGDKCRDAGRTIELLVAAINLNMTHGCILLQPNT
jgi:hypothetical protein